VTIKEKTQSSRIPEKTSDRIANEEVPSSERRTVTTARTTKAEKVIAMLREPKGATLRAIMAATDWQSHSVRGFISAQLIKKRKLRVRSFQRSEERVYKLSR
jgi:hypothetical protein